MPTQKRLLGDCAENIVCEYIKKMGYEILHRNYYIHNVGEIDIIAKKSDNLSFIEVKTRTKVSEIDTIRYCISKKKISNIQKCVDIYLQREYLHDLSVKIVGAFVYPELENKLRRIRIFSLE